MTRILLVLTLLCAGCTKFENPIVDESGRTVDPALLGEWIGRDEQHEAHFKIERADGIGRLTAIEIKQGEPTEPESYRLITAKIGNEHFASVQSESPAESNWFFFRYEVAGDRLRMNSDDDEFWQRAVADKMLPGNKDGEGLARRVTVTASEKELREFVAGYGSVIFKAEVLAELERK